MLFADLFIPHSHGSNARNKMSKVVRPALTLKTLFRVRHHYLASVLSSASLPPQPEVSSVKTLSTEGEQKEDRASKISNFVYQSVTLE